MHPNASVAQYGEYWYDQAIHESQTVARSSEHRNPMQQMEYQNPPRLLLISHDAIGRHMAGTGIRAWEMAHVLASTHPVTLLAPRPIDYPTESLRYGVYTPGDAASLTMWLHDADVVIAPGLLLEQHPELATISQPLVLDLYDPVFLEHIDLFRGHSLDERRARAAHDRAMLTQQLQVGDFFLCSTERQRDLYMGVLFSAGRITPDITDHDETLRSLIDVVPPGLPSTPPTSHHAAIRGIIPGILPEDRVVLWSGGLWDWMDPLTLIQALPPVLDALPSTRVVFLAGAHPGLARPPQIPAHARQLAQDLGLLNTSVFFYDTWVPYDDRAAFLLDADLLVSLHRHGLESHYAALRSRFLDHLWAGRASLVSSGDAAANLVETHQLGLVVPPADVSATTSALHALLSDDTLRQACAHHATSLAPRYTWEQVTAPLRTFCRAPTITRPRTPHLPPMSIRSSEPEIEPIMNTPTPPAPDAPESANDDHERNETIDTLNHLWKVHPQPLTSGVPFLGDLKERANSLTRWYIQTIVDQQNAFNAAVVHAVQALATSDDRRQNEIIAHVHAIHQESRESVQTIRNDLTNALYTIEQREQSLARRLALRIEANEEGLRALAHDLQQHLEQIQEHLDYAASHLEQRIERSEQRYAHLVQQLGDVEYAATRLAQEVLALRQLLDSDPSSSSSSAPAARQEESDS